MEKITFDSERVSRVEVIDDQGRAYVGYGSFVIFVTSSEAK